MKNNITVQELHEFIKENGEWNNVNINKCFDILQLPKGRILMSELFNIKKMLEILSNKCKSVNTTSYRLNGKLIWNIDILFASGERYQEKHEELCDGLWKAIKKII